MLERAVPKHILRQRDNTTDCDAENRMTQHDLNVTNDTSTNCISCIPHCTVKGKRQRHNTHIAPQAAYCSCSGAEQHRQNRRTAYAAAQGSAHGLWPAAIRSPSMPFNGLHPRNECNYINYYSFTKPGGMEG